MAPSHHHTPLLHCCAVLCACTDARQPLAIKAVDALGAVDLSVQACRDPQLTLVIAAPTHLHTQEAVKANSGAHMQHSSRFKPTQGPLGALKQQRGVSRCYCKCLGSCASSSVLCWVSAKQAATAAQTGA